MKLDLEIKHDVEEELQWEPDLDATDVAVTVKDGVVSLTGYVQSYSEKFQAESAAKRVIGVVGLANDIEVRLPSLDQRPDPEIAREAVSTLKAQLPLSSENIRVIVKAGHVNLEGIVDWQHQRTTAQDTVRRLRGVRDVTNLILVKPKVTPSAVKQKIEEAFRRNAEIDAGHVLVEAKGSEVVLRGTVRSWAEREEAQRAAWAAPGVTKIENRIAVSP